MNKNNNGKNKKKRGFTLIELLVVISIISLLSSVVMVAVTGARNKAKEKAFRSEIMQFVNALEMYKNDKGVYPNMGGAYYYVFSNKGVEVARSDPAGPNNLRLVMSNYIKDLPNPRGNNGDTAWYYEIPDLSGNIIDRCTGSVGAAPYLIIIEGTYWGSEFSDWPTFERVFNGLIVNISPGSHCFSLK